jgi:hypothetical protein
MEETTTARARGGAAWCAPAAAAARPSLRCGACAGAAAHRRRCRPQQRSGGAAGLACRTLDGGCSLCRRRRRFGGARRGWQRADGSAHAGGALRLRSAGDAQG